MNIKKHIPNFITILNLVCGVFAILFFSESLSVKGNGGCTGDSPSQLITIGVTLILIATVLDFLDGFAARLLKVQSEIGAQLDSLADMVTFGVAPGVLFLAFTNTINLSFNLKALGLIFIIIPVFSALRLAKFNVDTEQTNYFKGLATPANAIFWIGIFFFTETIKNTGFISNNVYYFLLIFLAIAMSLLMTSNLRMFSLKLKNLKFEGDNIYRVILILGAVILTITFGLFTNILASIPFIILLYILLSIHYHYTTRKTL